jgi:hypothetical protein
MFLTPFLFSEAFAAPHLYMRTPKLKTVMVTGADRWIGSAQAIE